MRASSTCPAGRPLAEHERPGPGHPPPGAGLGRRARLRRHRCHQDAGQPHREEAATIRRRVRPVQPAVGEVDQLLAKIELGDVCGEGRRITEQLARLQQLAFEFQTDQTALMPLIDDLKAVAEEAK